MRGIFGSNDFENFGWRAVRSLGNAHGEASAGPTSTVFGGTQETERVAGSSSMSNLRILAGRLLLGCAQVPGYGVVATPADGPAGLYGRSRGIGLRVCVRVRFVCVFNWSRPGPFQS